MAHGIEDYNEGLALIASWHETVTGMLHGIHAMANELSEILPQVTNVQEFVQEGYDYLAGRSMEAQHLQPAINACDEVTEGLKASIVALTVDATLNGVLRAIDELTEKMNEAAV